MQVGARTLREPAADELGFVCAVVVQDEVHVKFGRHVALDGIEKAAELARAMPTMQLAQHVAVGYVESGEQTGGTGGACNHGCRVRFVGDAWGSSGSVRSSA